MDELEKLRKEQANLLKEARAKLNEIDAKTSDARKAEIESEHDAIMVKWDVAERDAVRLERMETAERSLRTVDTSARPATSVLTAPAVAVDSEMKYRQAFYELQRAGSIGNVSPEARTVIEREQRSQLTSSPGSGGYLVPTELAKAINEKQTMFGPMLREDLFTIVNSGNGNKFDIPTADDTAVTAVPHVEGADAANTGAKDVPFGVKSLEAYDFSTEWITWSPNLASDSIISVESFLGNLLGKRLGRLANSKLTMGTGTNDVEGIVPASALGYTTATNSAITSDELLELEHSVDIAYRDKGTFMMHDSTVKYLRKLKNPTTGDYVWNDGNLSAGIPSSLLNRNVVINNDMDTIAAGKKVIVFGDFKEYLVRKVGVPSLYIANEKYAPNHGILGFQRLDGVLVQPDAVRHLKIKA